jgi:hypothetical protein
LDHQVLTLVIGALMLQAAGREGTVTGSLTLNGLSTPLTHVYASVEPGIFDKTAEDVHILLSDAPLSDEARADTFNMIHLARDGKARIVEVVIDASGQPISGSIYAKNFDGMVSVTGMHKLTRARWERSIVEGTLGMASPHEFMGVTFQYEARFRAPIPRPPTSEELAAALKSPAAHAVAAYVAAVRRGSLADLLATLTEAAAVDYRGADGGARLRELAADMPADTRPITLTLQTDGSVLVELEGRRASDGMAIGYTVRVIQENGIWKIGK